MLKSGSFLLIEIIKFKFQFDLVFVKRDLFCTKNRQNESESKDFFVYPKSAEVFLMRNIGT